jgi:hypothetical protein
MHLNRKFVYLINVSWGGLPFFTFSVENEEGGSSFLLKFGTFFIDYMVAHLRGQEPSE